MKPQYRITSLFAADMRAKMQKKKINDGYGFNVIGYNISIAEWYESGNWNL